MYNLFEESIQLGARKNLNDVVRDLRNIRRPPLPQIPASQLVLPRVIRKLRDRALIGLLQIRA